MMRELIVVFFLFLSGVHSASHTIDDVYKNVRVNYEKITKIGNNVHQNLTDILKFVYNHTKRLDNIEDRLQHLETSAKSQDESLKKLDGEMKDQRESLKSQEKTMKKLEVDLKDQGGILESQNKSLKTLDGDLKYQKEILKLEKDILDSQSKTLKKQNEVLRRQGNVSIEQGKTLVNQSKVLDLQGQSLIELDENLKGQREILINQGEALIKQEQFSEKASNRLDSLDTTVKDQGIVLKAQDKTLKELHSEMKEQTGILNGQGNILIEQKRTLDNESKTLEAQGQFLNKQKETITKQHETLEKVNGHMENVQGLLKKNLLNISSDVNIVKRVLTEVPPGKTHLTPAKSCSWLNERHYNLNTGNYWFLKEGGSSYERCKIDEAGIPATSCKELKKINPDLKSGTYFIAVKEKAFEVVCDMETDGGGWLMVGKAIVRRKGEAKEFDYETIQSNNFSQLAKVKTGRFLLSTTGLDNLYNLQPYTEIRFNCHKPSHGRRLHIKTTTNDVLQWLLRRRNPDPQPPSCGTFARLSDDTSFIGRYCKKWQKEKWWKYGVYNFPIAAFIDGWYDLSLDYNKHGLLCDDYSNHQTFSDVGEWSFYVR